MVLALLVFVFTGCDSNEESTPPVDDVVVIGTQVEKDFLNTGQFGVSATPLSAEGRGIISNDVKGEVTISGPNSSALVAKSNGSINGTVKIERLNRVSGDPLAVVVDIDDSGSMGSNDPDDDRVTGAQAFVDEVSANASNWEIAMARYSGSTPALNLNYTDMLLDFSNDVQALKDSAANVESSGGTPTYESLAELLIYSESERPKSNHEKAIVLLSDGNPNSIALRDSVCNDANRKESPIYTIGLGPASDVSPASEQSQFAINEMRAISDCSGASYAGIDPSDATASSEEIYRAIATAASQGSIIFTIEIDPTALQNHFNPGDLLTGSINLTAGGQSAGGDFSFTVPDPNASLNYKYTGE